MNNTNNDMDLYGMDHTEVAQQIGIQQIGFNLPQIYYNPFGAMFSVAIQAILVLKNGGFYTGVGCSTRPVNVEEDYQSILWEAQCNAMQQAFWLANISSPLLTGAFQGALPMGNNLFSDQNALTQNEVAHANTSKDAYQGGGDKPISPAQMDMITTMCSERAIDCNELSIGVCKKALAEFSGADADKMIKHLKSSAKYRKSSKN